MSVSVTEMTAMKLRLEGHRVVYEEQFNGDGERVGEKLWHYDLCPKCVEVSDADKENSGS